MTVFFDKLSDVMVVLVKSMESYLILDKHYLIVVLPSLCATFFAPISIVDGEFKTNR